MSSVDEWSVEYSEGCVSCASDEYLYAVSSFLGKRRLPVERSLLLFAGCASMFIGIVMEFWLGRTGGPNGRIAFREIGVGAYTTTESGVSVRTSTGRRRSCSIGSEKGSLLSVSLIDARLCLNPLPCVDGE